MGAIRSTIALNDGMSSALRNISNALNMTISGFQRMQSTCNESFNSAEFDAPRQALAQANVQLDTMTANIHQNESTQEGFNSKVNGGTSAMDGLGKKVLTAAAAYVTLQSAGKVINLSDTLTQTSARLNMMNDGMQTTGELQNEIFQSA